MIDKLLQLIKNRPVDTVRFLYVLGLAVTLVAIPIFNVGMSIGTIWLACNTVMFFIVERWVLPDEDFKTRNPFKNKVALALMGIYLLHVFALFYSENLVYGFNDLRIKVPLLVIPFMLAYLPRLNTKEERIILQFFIAAVLFSILTCLMVYWNWVEIPYENIRQITVIFITRVSHIRLSLVVILAVLVVMYLWKRHCVSSWLLLTIIPMLYFIVVVQSVTGMIIMALVLGYYLLYEMMSRLKWTGRIVGIVGLSGVFVASLFYINAEVEDYYYVENEGMPLEEFTSRGAVYEHHPELHLIENNHLVWNYVCWEELNSSWSEKSDLDLYGTDAKGQPVYGTLIRYMTSLGLRKDSDGIEALSEEDFRRVAQGQTNAYEQDKTAVQKRLHALLFEWDNYRNGGNPSGNSVVQRLEFWRVAVHIFKENPWFGVGTGDVQDVFDQTYVDLDSQLKEEYRLRAHNQYLTMAVTFGGVGLLLFLLLFCSAWLDRSQVKHFLFTGFFIIAASSFLAEDTLETQAGVTFVAFFYAFLLFQLDLKKSV